MSLTLLNISDIHFNRGQHVKSSKSVVDSTLMFIDKSDEIIILISGDIANTGAAEEYTLATEYLRQLQTQFESHGYAKPRVLSVPGNHDCDFSKKEQVRNAILKAITESPADPETLDLVAPCIECQSNYFSWSSSVSMTSHETLESKLLWIVEFTYQDKLIVFQCINTAWMSTRNEKQGGLRFPIKLVRKHSLAGDLVVTLMHHPYNWLNNASARSLRVYLEGSSDIVITGHEHIGEVSKRSIELGPRLTYVSGEVFAGGAPTNGVGFKLFRVDLINQRYEQVTFQWQSNAFIANPSEPQIQQFLRNSSVERPFPQLSEIMLDELSDPGASFTHRTKDVTLLDIYVCPDLRHWIKSTDNEFTPEVVSSPTALESILEKKYVVVSGDAQSGKSSLAKVLFGECVKRSIIPFLIRGEEIESSDSRAFERNLNKKCLYQFEANFQIATKRISPELQAIIVDDFHLAKLEPESRKELITWLKSRFGYVIIVGEFLDAIEDISLDPGQSMMSLGFEYFSIMEFGHLLRDRLIRKWLSMGVQSVTSQEAIEKRVNVIARVVSATLGENLIPRYPFVVLVLLQQYEANQPIKVENGQIGYYYDVLINLSLKRQKGSLDQIDLYRKYLSELAWYIHKNTPKYLDAHEIRDFTESHWNKFKLPYKKQTDKETDIVENLVECDILAFREKAYGFKYKYFYFYFLATYLSQNREDDRVCELIETMIQKIYREEYANILIFLSYLSPSNESLIDRIIVVSKNIFPDIEPCNVGEHVEFISALQDEMPTLIASDDSVTENRKTRLSQKDVDRSETKRFEPNASDAEEDTEQTKNDSSENLLMLNRSFKSLQVLGQLLRNFSGSLTGDMKRRICEECISIGLRSLNVIYKSLEYNFSGVKAVVETFLGKRLETIPKERRARVVNEIVFFLGAYFGYSIFKRISDAVGSEELVRTYEDVGDAGGNVSVQLVQSAILMDVLDDFPEKQVFRLSSNLQKRIFARTILCMLVNEHMYMFTMDFKQKQRVCANLGIKYGQGKVTSGKRK